MDVRRDFFRSDCFGHPLNLILLRYDLSSRFATFALRQIISAFCGSSEPITSLWEVHIIVHFAFNMVQPFAIFSKGSVNRGVDVVKLFGNC